MSALSTELFFQAGAELGEGPVWCPDRSELHWVDIRGGEIHKLAADGEHQVVVVRESVGSAIPLQSGDGWVAGTRSGVAIIASDGSVREHRPIDAERASHRMNDGACEAV